MIIDAHAHIFEQVRGLIAGGQTRGLGYGKVAIGDASLQVLPPLCEQTRHTPEMLIAHMDWVGVDKAVLLQGSFYGECNEYVRQSVQSYSDRLIGVAYVDPWADGARGRFDAVVSANCFRGLKLEMSEPTGFSGLYPGVTLSTPDLTWIWDGLEKSKMVLVLDLGAVGSASYQTDAVRKIAEDHPNLKLVIAHLGQPTPIAEADPSLWKIWQNQIDLGSMPNVWFDTASIPAYLAEEGYPYPSGTRYIQAAVERIGPEKIMWGTDVPGLLAHATYPQLRKAAQMHTAFLSVDDQARIMGGNAAEVFG
ncbi:MAG: amidohydrolase family protein [Armatimonadota bacterium]